MSLIQPTLLLSFTLSTCFYIYGCAVRYEKEQEPNNTAVTATPLHSVKAMRGTIEDDKDIDFFRIEAGRSIAMKLYIMRLY